MRGNSEASCANHGCYFERPAERLVLEGYRRWIAGFDTGSIEPWELAWHLYEETLGAEAGRRAMAELGHFVRTLKLCARCPLRFFPFGAHHVCQAECLTLGLMAGLQHRDHGTVGACLDAMACPVGRGRVEEAAASFAGMLAEYEQFLLPIPRLAIEDILSRPAGATKPDATGATIH